MALEFIAGCLGGCAGVVVGHPLDTVKVRLQTQDTRNPKYTGTIHCIRSILAKDGVRGVYRGITSPLLGVAGINAIVFGVHGNTQKRLKDPDTLRAHGIAGAAAGFFQSFICSPVELAKSRLQVADSTCKGPVECLQKIYESRGFKGLFRGLGLTIAREVPAFSSYFLTYEFLTRRNDDKPVSTMVMLAAGGAAGIVSWSIVYPIDVLKSRFQIDGITSTKYTSAYDCLSKSLKSEGAGFLFRGLTPTLIRAFPVNAVTFTVVTWTYRLASGGIFEGKVKETEFIWERYAESFCGTYLMETA